MEQKKNKKWNLKISIAEFICYIVGGLVALWGISYIVVGLIARYSTYSSNLAIVNRNFKGIFGLGFMGWGLIILSIAALFIVIILCACARTSDREFEKNQRRAARLAQMKEARTNPEAEIVVDAPIENK